MSSVANSTFYDLLDELQRIGLTEPSSYWQLLLLLGCIGLGWFLARLLRPKLTHDAQSPWRIGTAGIARVLSPLLALGLLSLVIVVWRGNHHVGLLRFGASLLSVLVLVRVAVYVLREVFSSATWLHRSERLIASIVWLGFALHMTGLLPELLAALDDLSLTIGQLHISALMVLNGLLSVAATLLIALWLARLFEQRMMSFDGFDLSFRVVATKFAKTILIIAAVLIALPLVGIPLSVLSVFGGAVGVGLGFGLQKVASNYVSGFIILLDRSVRIGDLVKIDGHQGTISAITARYVVLKASDGAEAIIPNETLITSTVLNLSYNDKVLRVAMPFLVNHDCDLEQALALVMDAALVEPRILAEPTPQVLVKSFAADGIELELSFWIGDPEEGTGLLRSELNLRVWQAFRQNGIVIPYPQREVRLIDATQKVLDSSRR